MTRSSRIKLHEWLFLLAMGGLLFWLLGYDEVQSYRGARAGREAAKADVAAGVVTLQIGGRPPIYRRQVIALYKERHGIHAEFTGNCCSVGYERGYHAGYREVVLEVLGARPGGFDYPRTHEEIIELARAQWEAEREQDRAAAEQSDRDQPARS